MCPTLVMSPLACLADSLTRTASYSKLCPPSFDIPLKDFIHSSEAILPMFDHLGPVFGVARSEFSSKLSSLVGASAKFEHLTAMIAADVAARCATSKNSCTRNLHRLLSAILFTKLLLERLLRSPEVALREAAAEAYEASIAPFHTGLIRGIVRAGMLTLPSREGFLVSIGESEESARPRLEEVIESCTSVIAVTQKLLSGIDFPVSDVWFWPSS